MPYIGQQPTNVAFLTDQFSGNGSTTAFTLSAAPANTSSILVAISGVLQDPSTYSVSGTTLTFSPAPPTGTGNISVRFLGIPASGVTTTAYRTVTEFTATAGQTTFSVPSYTVGFIDVYRNGVLLGSADYTATSGVSVVLATGCLVGDLVEVISFSVSSVLNAIPATAGSVGSSNIANGVTINFADGSASTPSITNDGDTNTGMFFPAADTIAFAEGGVEAMRLDSSGSVGIGTTSPTANVPLTLQAGSGYTDILWLRSVGTNIDSRINIAPTGTGLAQINNTVGTPLAFQISGVERGRFDASGNFLFNSGYGSVATAYGCRAWVNFNGTGTVAIRASGNVTSITDNGTGDYTVNFTTAMPDANYAAAGFGQAGGGYAIRASNVTQPTASAFRFSTVDPGVAVSDTAVVYVTFHR
jgi:hypothetical protein